MTIIPSDITPAEAFKLLQKLQLLLRCDGCKYCLPYSPTQGECDNPEVEMYGLIGFTNNVEMYLKSFGCRFWEPRKGKQ